MGVNLFGVALYHITETRVYFKFITWCVVWRFDCARNHSSSFGWNASTYRECFGTHFGFTPWLALVS